MTRPVPANLKELFSYRLNRLAHVSSRMAARANESQYDLGSRDWRIIGLLGAFAPMSLNALAHEANIDKSQASRSVGELIDRGYIKRGADESDGRGVRLDLTTQGRALYRKVFPKAVDRNERILEILSPEERDVLERAIDKLTDHTLGLLDELKNKPVRDRSKAAVKR
ncbi:MarR family transcriptional regulator [Pigmentiphaga litoralis]|jgi:DNA-binding MarR family transcriptional regulator|uniref:MarR family winged helix-turn-helix transcriptional regulator n=1 Tax=Pigmentiphaga litoralis TaxID=516702 RepID=UPI001679489A|nr:MarR family winged helix-turn-helix transcriptional regulator [Pigmentiphaga litoralis]GGX34138.1 MarR family transcriptional regulator [Pigmentiphaga litoralis]